MSVPVAEAVVVGAIDEPTRSARSPIIGALAYIGCWAIGLTMFPAAPALDEATGAVADFYARHAAASALQAGMVHGVAAIALLVVVLAMRSRGVTGATVRAGVAAVVLSLVQFVVEVVRAIEAGGTNPTTVDGFFDAVNRLDGVKMIALAVMVGTSARALRAAGYPLERASGIVVRATAVALVVSGVGYVVLDRVVAMAAFVSLPLLLISVGTIGWSLSRGRR